jgi:hypothetical protein
MPTSVLGDSNTLRVSPTLKAYRFFGREEQTDKNEIPTAFLVHLAPENHIGEETHPIKCKKNFRDEVKEFNFLTSVLSLSTD